MGGTSYRVADQADGAGRQARREELPRSGIDAGALDHHQPGERRQASAGTARGEAARRRLGGRQHGAAASTSRPTSARPGQPAQARPAEEHLRLAALDRDREAAERRLLRDLDARRPIQRGVMQPHIAGNWNPQGYGANPMHRVAIRIGMTTDAPCAHVADRLLALLLRRRGVRAGAGVHAARREAGGLSGRRPAATTLSMPAPPATASRSSRSRGRPAGNGKTRSTG